MALPVINDTLRVAVRGTAPNGHHWANVMHFRKPGAMSYANAINILDARVQGLYESALGGGTSWKAHSPASYQTLDYTFTPLDGTSASTVRNHITAGTNAGEPLPAQVALVITLRTVLRGRSYRGRVYWNGFVETANLASGGPDPVVVAAVQSQWNGFLASLIAGDPTMVVASYLHSTAQDLSAVTVDASWDTQRRRLRP